MRVWRLSAALSGDPGIADAVARRVAAACRRLDTIDPVRVDRLAVLWTREAQRAVDPVEAGPLGPAVVAGGRAPDAVLPAPVLSLLAALSGQPREAWMLARVFEFEIIRVARSMDCSRTAAQRFLDHADAVVNSPDPDHSGPEQTQALRAWLAAQPAPARAEAIGMEVWRARRHRRTVRHLVGGLIVLLALWALVSSIGN